MPDPFSMFEPDAEDFLGPIRQNAKRDIHSLVADKALIAAVHPRDRGNISLGQIPNGARIKFTPALAGRCTTKRQCKPVPRRKMSAPCPWVACGLAPLCANDIRLTSSRGDLPPKR